MPHSLLQSESIRLSSIAARLASPLRPGHYDEMRGAADSEGLRDSWQRFFDLLGPDGYADLDRRAGVVARQIRENGITYNVYADTDGAARPWSLDLLPFIIEAQEWAGIEAGVAQRARLLNAIVADTYDKQELLSRGLLPPALVQGHPGYLRPLHGYKPPGGIFMHIAAFDLARAPDGRWWVVSQRVQAPSGLGYMLENRLTISRLFPDAFRELQVQHLASSYRRLLETLYRLSDQPSQSPGSSSIPLSVSASVPPGGKAVPRIVLLTPGPYNETYFEHSYLARYLGLTLVEGSDLTVRDDHLYLKTLHGLERVHAVLRRLDDDYCDPLELRTDSTLGVPGLVQAMRAGNVLVANALGAGFLESPSINGFLPGIAHHLMGEALKLPSLSCWWAGEAAARRQILPYVGELVVKPTYPRSIARPGFEPLIGVDATAEQIELCRRRIAEDPDAYTLQAYLPLSQAPTWTGGHIVPRAAMVRVFAIADENGSWHVLPGGLTRIGSSEQQVVSMQRGGSSLDTWVMTAGAVDGFSMLPERLRLEDLAEKRRPVSSRAAENLFWMGRYTERIEQAVRLARLVLTWLNGDDELPRSFNDVLAHLCFQLGLVSDSGLSPSTDPHQFERVLIVALPKRRDATSVGYNLAALANSAGQIRDRLSTEHWRLIVAAGVDFEEQLKAAVSPPNQLDLKESKPDAAAAAMMQSMGTSMTQSMAGMSMQMSLPIGPAETPPDHSAATMHSSDVQAPLAQAQSATPAFVPAPPVAASSADVLAVSGEALASAAEAPLVSAERVLVDTIPETRPNVAATPALTAEWLARLPGEVSAVDALAALDHLGVQLGAITGAQTDRMTRDDGWRLLTVGRQIERLAAMASALYELFENNTVLTESGFGLLLDLFDSTITYRAHYQRRLEIPALVELLVLDQENPRSLACVIATLRLSLSRMPDNGNGSINDLLQALPADGTGEPLNKLCEKDAHGIYTNLVEHANELRNTAYALSNEVGRRYFSHAADAEQTLAA